jgi:hypothetical protein
MQNWDPPLHLAEYAEYLMSNGPIPYCIKMYFVLMFILGQLRFVRPYETESASSLVQALVYIGQNYY